MLWILIIIMGIYTIMKLNENKQLAQRCKKLVKYSISIEDKYEAMYNEFKKYFPIKNAQEEATRIIQDTQAKVEKIEKKLSEEQEKINEEIQQAHLSAEKIINEAKQKAIEIAGNALDAKENAKSYENIAKSMKNIILGYGTEYLIPSSDTLLDNLADTYGFTQASKDYKEIRQKIREKIKHNLAATCDYAEQNRRSTAISFVTDAFNGKAETILSKAKSDNFGTLKQQLIDAFTLVNFNGTAFRNARINQEFFNMRMEELRLACIIHELHQKDLEEQKQIRDKIREEEKVRRDIEKALNNAQKEEEILQKAMEKARIQLEKANAEQRANYEAQIAELEKKYHEAEERNKRALSMAQQTKLGHIYIISNEGSFGRNIYKIGMTRRLEPLERVRELSNASVPFPFEVHAIIWSENAPALETMLHKKFALYQVNKVNFRKEFFRIPLSEIKAELERNDLDVKWTITSQTTEYLESLAIEKAIQNNEQAREAWLNHQFELASTEYQNNIISSNNIEISSDSNLLSEGASNDK